MFKDLKDSAIYGLRDKYLKYTNMTSKIFIKMTSIQTCEVLAIVYCLTINVTCSSKWFDLSVIYLVTGLRLINIFTHFI